MKRTPFRAWLERSIGRAYPVADIKEHQEYFGRLGSHVEAEWTTPEHWAHNNYDRSHLPQLCVRASGWKARLLAVFLRPEPPWVSEWPLDPEEGGFWTQLDEGKNPKQLEK